MPIYCYECPECKLNTEILQKVGAPAPDHCGAPMRKRMNFPAMVKVKGEGGYPSRRKFVRGTAPYSGAAKEWRGDINNTFNAPPERTFFGPSRLKAKGES